MLLLGFFSLGVILCFCLYDLINQTQLVNLYSKVDTLISDKLND